MKYLLSSAGFLLMDLASTVVFLLVVLVAKNVAFAIVAGMAFGVAQIGWELARKQPVGVIQWMSLFLVLGFGAVSLATRDARLVMIKPSLIYLIVGSVMLKPGWMIRYLPPIAQELAPDLAFAFGYVWAGLMFVSAGLVFYAALTLKPVAWASFVSVWGLASKAALFGLQFGVMRWVAGRRFQARVAATAA
jgi:intracellular septation protein